MHYISLKLNTRLQQYMVLKWNNFIHLEGIVIFLYYLVVVFLFWVDQVLHQLVKDELFHYPYLVHWLHFDSVLNMIIWSGTPPNQILTQSSTTIRPATLKPAANTGSSFNLAHTLLVAIPVTVTVCCCFGCVAYCKIKAGWVLSVA